jgi:cytochrome c-type biogenesis protein CcmE
MTEPGRSRSRRGIAAGGVLVVLAGFVYLLSGSIGENLVYFLTPGELAARGTDAVDEPVRLGGLVKAGTVKWDAAALDLRFVIQDSVGGELPVRAHDTPPPMFREGQGVVVEGRLTAAGVFEADNLMVRHSNEYRAPTEGADPQETYKSLMRDPQGR